MNVLIFVDKKRWGAEGELKRKGKDYIIIDFDVIPSYSNTFVTKIAKVIDFFSMTLISSAPSKQPFCTTKIKFHDGTIHSLVSKLKGDLKKDF